MKVLSLFSGVGGFDMGLENAGMETVFQCEWDKHANSILHKHWPDVPKWDDVSTLTGKHILAHAPVIDVVAWGSPCQDLSVAGKRAGLEGGRSGLFHEGIRIIKELQEETNGQYPRISIWENVVGALSSNGGADFGIILDEMAEAGAVVIEWTVLDAQYWIPQRRKRVFVIAIFDPLLAERCPSPLLPVAESLPGHLTKGKQKRKSVATTLTESTGTDGGIVNAIGASLYHHGTVVNQDANAGHMIVESEVVGSLAARDYKGVGNQYVAENKLVTEPYVKSSRAQRSDDSETWIPGEVNPTLNSFDVVDTRATTAIVEPVAYHFDSLSSNSMKSSNPHSGVNEVEQARTLDTWRPDPSLNQGGLAIVEPMLAIPIQDGRDIEKHQNGLGVAEAGSPAYTLDQTGAQAVAIGIQGNMIGRQDHNGPAGKGYTDEGDPMFTLNTIDHHAVATEMRVRRLTPDECCLLMGWPKHWNKYKADGTEQADTHRYKQCGNGVASPVAQWIAKHILAI